MKILVDTVLRGPQNERERVLALAEVIAGVDTLAIFHVTATADKKHEHFIPIEGHHPRDLLAKWLEENLPGYAIVEQ
jgi:hypothetical protein